MGVMSSSVGLSMNMHRRLEKKSGTRVKLIIALETETREFLKP